MRIHQSLLFSTSIASAQRRGGFRVTLELAGEFQKSPVMIARPRELLPVAQRMHVAWSIARISVRICACAAVACVGVVGKGEGSRSEGERSSKLGKVADERRRGGCGIDAAEGRARDSGARRARASARICRPYCDAARGAGRTESTRATITVMSSLRPPFFLSKRGIDAHTQGAHSKQDISSCVRVVHDSANATTRTKPAARDGPED